MTESLTVGDTLVVSLRSVVTVFTIYVFGILLSGFFKKIDQQGVKTISSLVASLFIPCFYIARLGESFSYALLLETWKLPLAYLVTVILNVILTHVLIMPFAKINSSISVWFGMGQYFANVLALPLLVTPSLCSQLEFKTSILSSFNESSVLEIEECVVLGETYLILNSLLSQFVYWLTVFPYVQKCGPPLELDEEEDPRVVEMPVTVPVSSTSTEAATEDKSAGAQTQFEITDAAFEAKSDATDTGVQETKKVSFQQVVKPVSTNNGEHRPLPRRLRHWTKSERRRKGISIYKALRLTLLKGAVFSQIVGCVVGLTPALSTVFFANGAALEPIGAAVSATARGFAPVVNLALSATLGLQGKTLSWSSVVTNPRDEYGVHQRTYFMFVVGRMVLLPAANFALFYVIQDYVLPEDRLMRLMFYSILATPTANLHVVIASILGDYTAANFLARAAFYQFCVGAVTYALFLFLAVLMSEV